MKTSSALKKVWNRREFFRSGVRYGAVAAIAAIVVDSTRRRLNSPSQTCINQGYCPGCTQFADCGLPRAISVRSVSKGGRS